MTARGWVAAGAGMDALTVLAGGQHNSGVIGRYDKQLQSRSDAELVSAYRSNADHRYFEALYLRHRQRLFGLCLHFLGSAAAAEETVHESFVRSYEQFASLRGDNYGGWLTRIATNLCLNRLRARRPQVPADESLEDQTAKPPEQGVAGGQEKHRARAVLAALSPPQRRALELKYFDGHTYEEIGRIMHANHDQVRSLLQNGRRNFRRLWAGSAAPGESGP